MTTLRFFVNSEAPRQWVQPLTGYRVTELSAAPSHPNVLYACARGSHRISERPDHLAQRGLFGAVAVHQDIEYIPVLIHRSP